MKSTMAILIVEKNLGDEKNHFLEVVDLRESGTRRIRRFRSAEGINEKFVVSFNKRKGLITIRSKGKKGILKEKEGIFLVLLPLLDCDISAVAF